MFRNCAYDDTTIIVTFDIINRKLRILRAIIISFGAPRSVYSSGNPGPSCFENPAPNVRTRYKSDYPNLNLESSTINAIHEPSFSPLHPACSHSSGQSSHFRCIRRHVGRDACAPRMINSQSAPDHVDDLERPPSLFLSSLFDSPNCMLINAQNHRLGSVPVGSLIATHKGNVQKVEKKDFLTTQRNIIVQCI